MNTLKGIVTDLRQRRLWPVALALVLALVAIPVLLHKKANSTPVAQLPATGAPVAGSCATGVLLAFLDSRTGTATSAATRTSATATGAAGAGR